MAPGKDRVTLRDVAARAKVSPTTVSMVLNGKARENHISEITCKRIMKIVSELNYVPNPHARAISRGRTDLIGVVMRDNIGHSFWAEILSGMEKVLVRTGRHIILSFFKADAVSEQNAFSFLKQKGVDAYIWTPMAESDFDAVKQLVGGKPLLLLTASRQGFASVKVDENAGGKAAAGHFLDLGFKKAAAIGIAAPVQNRIGAFYDEFSAHGECRIFASVNDFMNRVKEFPAVFCFSDDLALQLYQACRDAGIRIPEDLSVIGYDNQFFTSLMTPPLTTVNQPKCSFGESAGNLLVGMLDGNEQSVCKLLPPDLVIRESCISR